MMRESSEKSYILFYSKRKTNPTNCLVMANIVSMKVVISTKKDSRHSFFDDKTSAALMFKCLKMLSENGRENCENILLQKVHYTMLYENIVSNYLWKLLIYPAIIFTSCFQIFVII